MTGNRTRVSDPQAGVHTGSGNQINFVTWMLGANEHLLRAGTARLTLVREQRRRLVGCFVPPRHYGRAVERLEPRGSVVLLDGPPGLGRRAAATMLLEEAPAAVRPVEELPPTGEEGPFEVSADDRYLLDLSSVTDGEYRAAERTLVQYRSVVEQGDARMVVILPAGLGWMLHEDLSSLVVTLGRPRGRHVLGRHLRAWNVPFDAGDLDTEELRHLFDSAPMRELARLAELVAEARDSQRYGSTFLTWCAEAVAAATNWSDDVARQLRNHRGAHERALLLAAAMVSGAPAEAALKGAQLLLDVLRHEPDGPIGLARADLGEQLMDLGIERNDDGQIVFARLEYDSAVRRHFWTNFPDLRLAFRDWVARCVDIPDLTADGRMKLIARFAEQAMATGCPGHVCSLVEAWTRQQDGRFRAEAAAVLELGLSHERYGSYFRSRVYYWAIGRISSELAHVLTDVCRQVIAATHPEQAAVRLRHLTLRHTGKERDAARTALLELARADRRVFRRLTDRIISLPLADGADELLLDLLDPVPLRIAPPYKEFALGWRALLMTRTAAEWTPLLHRWLDALSRGTLDHRIVGSLIVAAAGDYGALNRLYVAVCQWWLPGLPTAPGAAHIPPETRQRVGELFCREVDVLLGMSAAHSAAEAPERGERP
ncbi:hypothetical protein ABZ953_35210 [Streptomyces sp. NPDC046465]|uniref:hypothetical protein n=1 Tax=Streptomyces sp. NPDC046465 TaxID=3155810 RepID=UPI0033E9D88D